MKGRKDKLTLFLDCGHHGFIGLQCQSCADGKPADFKAGFYPYHPASDRDLADLVSSSMDADKQRKHYKKAVHKLWPAVISLQNTIARQGSLAPFIKTGLASISNQEYSIVNEGGIDGKTKYDSAQDGINFAKRSSYRKKELAQLYQIAYEINPEDSLNIYAAIKHMTENNITDYHYNSFTHNCLDFTREMYLKTSLEKKSRTAMYGLNPILSGIGLNGLAGAYMLGKDAYEMIDSNAPFFIFAGYNLYKLYQSTYNFTSKMSRGFFSGDRFDPKSISNNKWKRYARLIKATRTKLLEILGSVEEDLITAREAANDCYGDAARKDEYAILSANYSLIRKFFNDCEVELTKFDQLTKDYDSLKKEHCSKQYAHQILTEIETIYKYYEIINDVVAANTQTQKDNKPNSSCTIRR